MVHGVVGEVLEGGLDYGLFRTTGRSLLDRISLLPGGVNGQGRKCSNPRSDRRRGCVPTAVTALVEVWDDHYFSLEDLQMKLLLPIQGGTYDFNGIPMNNPENFSILHQGLRLKPEKSFNSSGPDPTWMVGVYVGYTKVYRFDQYEIREAAKTLSTALCSACYLIGETKESQEWMQSIINNLKIQQGILKWQINALATLCVKN